MNPDTLKARAEMDRIGAELKKLARPLRPGATFECSIDQIHTPTTHAVTGWIRGAIEKT